MPLTSLDEKLLTAVKNRNKNAVKELLKIPEEMEHKEYKNYSLDSKFQHFESKEDISTIKININCCDEKDNTPLHLAVENGDLDMVEILINAGAKTFLTNKLNKSPLQDALTIDYIKRCKKINVDEKVAHSIRLILLSNRTSATIDDIECALSLCRSCYKSHLSDVVESSDTIKALFDFTINRLAGCSLNGKPEDRIKYAAQLAEKKGQTSVDGFRINIEGFSPNVYLSYRLRSFFKIFIEIEYGAISASTLVGLKNNINWEENRKILLDFLYQELLTTLETLHIRQCIDLITDLINSNASSKQIDPSLLKDMIEEARLALAKNLLKSLKNLKPESTLCFPGGWFEHAIYINFNRDPENEDHVVVRIDNVGGGSSRSWNQYKYIGSIPYASNEFRCHELALSEKNHIYPCSLGSIPQSIFNFEKAGLSYFAGIIEAASRLPLSDHKELRDFALSAIYDHNHELSTLKTKMERKNNFPPSILQKVGNCTSKFNISFKYRIYQFLTRYLKHANVTVSEKVEKLYDWLIDKERELANQDRPIESIMLEHLESNTSKKISTDSVKYMDGLIAFEKSYNQRRPLSFEKSLKEYYLESYVNTKSLFKVEAPIEGCFINLSLIKEKLSSERKNHLFENSSVVDKNKPIELVNIFKQSKKNKKIVIKGKIGSGKSTLCQYISYMWASNKLWQDQFDAVIWVPLRHIKINKKADEITRLDIIKEALLKFSATKLDDALLMKEIENKRILFILDGYDELIDGSSIKDFVDNKFLYEKYLIVTSRLEYPIPLHNVVELELIGFTDDNINKYINNFFKSIQLPKKTSFMSLIEEHPHEIKTISKNTSDKNALSQIMINFLKSNPNYWHLSHIPIFLEIFCHAWSDIQSQGKENASVSQLLNIVIQKMLQHYLEKNGKDIEPTKVINYFHEEIIYLERLAFEMAKSENYIGNLTPEIISSVFFKVENSEKIFRVLLDIGFITSARRDSPPFSELLCHQSYEFNHLIFQDFFAACHLKREMAQSNLSDGFKKASEFILYEKYQKRYLFMLSLTAGLISQDKSEKGAISLKYFWGLLESSPRCDVGYTHLYLVLHCFEEASCDARVPKYKIYSNSIEKIISKIYSGNSIKLAQSFFQLPHIIKHFKFFDGLFNFLKKEYFDYTSIRENIFGLVANLYAKNIIPTNINLDVLDFAKKSLSGLDRKGGLYFEIYCTALLLKQFGKKAATHEVLRELFAILIDFDIRDFRQGAFFIDELELKKTLQQTISYLLNIASSVDFDIFIKKLILTLSDEPQNISKITSVIEILKNIGLMAFNKEILAVLISLEKTLKSIKNAPSEIEEIKKLIASTLAKIFSNITLDNFKILELILEDNKQQECKFSHEAKSDLSKNSSSSDIGITILHLVSSLEYPSSFIDAVENDSDSLLYKSLLSCFPIAIKNKNKNIRVLGVELIYKYRATSTIKSVYELLNYTLWKDSDLIVRLHAASILYQLGLKLITSQEDLTKHVPFILNEWLRLNEDNKSEIYSNAILYIINSLTNVSLIIDILFDKLLNSERNIQRHICRLLGLLDPLFYKDLSIIKRLFSIFIEESSIKELIISALSFIGRRGIKEITEILALFFIKILRKKSESKEINEVISDYTSYFISKAINFSSVQKEIFSALLDDDNEVRNLVVNILNGCSEQIFILEEIGDKLILTIQNELKSSSTDIGSKPKNTPVKELLIILEKINFSFAVNRSFFSLLVNSLKFNEINFHIIAHNIFIKIDVDSVPPDVFYQLIEILKLECANHFKKFNLNKDNIKIYSITNVLLHFSKHLPFLLEDVNMIKCFKIILERDFTMFEKIFSASNFNHPILFNSIILNLLAKNIISLPEENYLETDSHFTVHIFRKLINFCLENKEITSDSQFYSKLVDIAVKNDITLILFDNKLVTYDNEGAYSKNLTEPQFVNLKKAIESHQEKDIHQEILVTYRKTSVSEIRSYIINNKIEDLPLNLRPLVDHYLNLEKKAEEAINKYQVVFDFQEVNINFNKIEFLDKLIEFYLEHNFATVSILRDIRYQLSDARIILSEYCKSDEVVKWYMNIKSNQQCFSLQGEEKRKTTFNTSIADKRFVKQIIFNHENKHFILTPLSQHPLKKEITAEQAGLCFFSQPYTDGSENNSRGDSKPSVEKKLN